MDYHSLKRPELQALCKKHKIPANSANSVMADKLSEFLNEKQKPRARQRTCIKSPVDTTDENESAVSRRQSKRVRFSPEVEYEQSGEKQRAVEPVVLKGRRKSVAKKVDEPAVDNVNTVTDDDVQIPVKVTRSRANLQGKDDAIPTNERKQGRRAVKSVEKETDAVKETEGKLEKATRSKANTVGKGVVQLDKNKQSKNAVKEIEKENEPVKETVVAPARVTRAKAQTLTEDSKDPDLTPQVKKKCGRQTKKDEEKVEPSKEVKDVPVRATRSRGQASQDDNVVANLQAEKKKTRKDDAVVANPPVEKKRTRNDDSVVANPPVEKKRTRRETMVADLSHNLGNKDESEKLGRGGRHKKSSGEKTAEVSEIQDNADKGTRQSRRNKANVEDSTAPNQNESKMEVVNDRKVTRSKAALAKKPSVGKGNIEEPLEPAGKKNVNRRKSVIQPKLPEVVLPLEEPENVPAKRDTRRKSAVQKVQEKVSKKPLVAKMETKETELPGSPNVRTRKAVEKLQSKDALENKTETVASGSGSHKTRKRRGDPIIEDQTIETEPVSTLKDSAVKKDQGSGVKTPASGKGVISGDTRSKKRAKSNTKPISKMENLEIDDKVMEAEQTPAIAESGRRYTRSAIRSDRKEPSQSTVKKQKTAARLSSSKTPGRFTRSGMKIDEKMQPSESTHQSQSLIDAEMASPEDAEAKSSPDESIAGQSEVSKEANSQILEQTGDLSAPESVRSPTIDALSDGVQVVVSSEKSAIPEVLEKEMEVTESSIMGTPISKMENLELDDKVIETEQIPAIAESGRRFTRSAIRSDRKEPSQSTIKKQKTAAHLSSRKTPGRFTRSGIKVDEKVQPSESTHHSQPPDDAKMVSPDAAEVKHSPDETIVAPAESPKEANAQILEQSSDLSAPESVMSPTIDAIADGSHAQNQNQEVYVGSEKSAIPEVLEKETELSNSDTMGTPISKMANLELDDKVIEAEQIPAIKEPSQSAIKEQKTGAARFSSRKTPGRFTCSGIKVDEKNQLDESTLQSQPLDDAQTASHEAAEAKSSPDETLLVSFEAPEEANAPILEQSGDLSAPESVMSPTIDAVSDGSQSQDPNQEAHVSSEIVSEAVVQIEVNSEKSVIPEVSETELELTKSESTLEGLENDVMVEETFVSVSETVVIEESVGISLEQSDATGKSKEETEAPQQPSIAEGLSQLFADDEDDTEVEEDDEDKKVSNEKHEDVADRVDAQEMDAVEGDDAESNREETQDENDDEDDKLQGLGMDENDAEDEKVTILPESMTTHSEPEKEFDVVEAEKEPVTVTESSTAHSEPAKELESDAVLSTRNDVHEIPILGNSDEEDEDEGADDVKEHESNTNDEDGKAEQESEDVPVLPEVSNSFSDHKQEPSQNEDVPEVSIKSPDQESEPAVSLAADEPPSETVDESTSKDSPQSPAIGFNAMEESIDGLEKEEKPIETSSELDGGVHLKESESVPLDMSIEEAELATESDHALVEEKEQTDNDMEDYQNHVVAEENPTMEESSPSESMKEESTVDGLATDQLPGDLGAYGSPTTEEESPVDDTVSDPPTAFKNEDLNNQDWGFGTDDFQKPVSADKNDDVVGAPSTDDQASSLKTCSPAVATASEDFFNWSVDETEGNATPYPDSSLKTLSKTPPAAATTQVSFAKATQETKVKFALPEEDDTEVDTRKIPDSSLKRLFTTPATAVVSHVKDRQASSSTVRFALPHEVADNTEGSASLKSLFATPSTARATHVNNSQQSFGLPYDSFGHDENQDNNASSSQNEDGKNESFGVMTFEEFSHKYFDDEEGDDASGGKDQVDDMAQHDLSSEIAGKSHHEAKDKSVYSDNVFVKNEEPQQPKDLETGDEDSSLNALFKTPGTTTSHVEAHQQSAIKSGERRQNPGLIEDPKLTFEDFAHKYFGDAKDDGQFDFKNDQEASGTGEKGTREM